MSDLVDRSARELRVLIEQKDASPVELFDACCARIEAIDSKLNAFVAHNFERGRRAAQAAEAAVINGDPLGLLHGLPVAIKDLMSTEGLTTTFGSLVYRDHVPANDDLPVARLRQAGAIIIGKTNTPEFGAGSNTVNLVHGATVNPFDPTLSCGGSSGGSAVALATDMVPLATGSDMGGSLRTPASYCGVVGHRTSPGSVPSDVRSYAWNPLTVDGPMGRNVADAALLMAAMVGADNSDPLSYPLDTSTLTDLAPVDIGSLRVAFSADLGVGPMSQAVRKHFEDCAVELSKLFASSDWRDPDLADAQQIFAALRAVAYADIYGDYVSEHRERAGPNVIENAEFAKAVTVRDVGRAHADQTALFRRFQTFFDDIDILICPSSAVVPYPVEQTCVSEIDGIEMPTYISWITIMAALTLTTHPVTTIPCGLGPTNMPFGLQIVGRHRDDAGTLAIAAAIEAALAQNPKFARPVPNIEALIASSAESMAGQVPPQWEAHP